MRVSDFYRSGCAKRLKLESLKAQSSSRMAVLYQMLDSVSSMWNDMDGLEKAVSKALSEAYSGETYTFDWQRERQIQNDTFCLMRFFRFLTSDGAELVSTNLTVLVPAQMPDGTNEVRTKVPYIIRRNGKETAVLVRFERADKSMRGKSYHTCIQTDLAVMTAKAALEEDHPGILIQVVYMYSDRDTETEMPEELVCGDTRSANVFTMTFSDYYADGWFQSDDFMDLLNQVVSTPLPIVCYGCKVAALCRSEELGLETESKSVQKGSAAPYKLPDYTKAQKEVIDHMDGPLLVCAGPGSGKTATLVGRVKKLIESGVEPENQLVITFTREAAEELRTRCASFCEEWSMPKISTLNALGYEIIRAHSELVDGGTELLSAAEKMQIIENLLKAFPKIDGISYAVEYGRNGLYKTVERKLDAYLSMPPEDFYQKEKKLGTDFGRFAEEYRKIVKARGLITFDEQISLANQLFQEHPEILEIYRGIYRYVMVDEFQDVNEEQARFVYAIAGSRRNLVVVGDDDQALYGFRGATNRFMLSFMSDFPGAKRIVLSENFRSTGAIVGASQKVIAANTGRIEKSIRAIRSGGMKPEVVSGCESADFDSIVQRCISSGYHYADIAVLSTKNAPLEELHRTMLKPTVLNKSYLRVTPLFVFIRTVLSLWKNAEDVDMLSTYLYLCGIEEKAEQVRAMYPALDSDYFLSERSGDKIYSAMRRLALSLEVVNSNQDLGFICLNLAYFIGKEGSNSLKAMQELLDTQRLTSKEALLEHMNYMVEFEDETRSEVEPVDAVTLITAHESKGKEYPVVLLKDDFGDSTEEARRVFYVALTRAKDRVYVLSDNTNGKFVKELSAA